MVHLLPCKLALTGCLPPILNKLPTTVSHCYDQVKANMQTINCYGFFHTFLTVNTITMLLLYSSIHQTLPMKLDSNGTLVCG